MEVRPGGKSRIGDMRWEMGRDSKQGGGRPIPMWFDNQGIIFYICLKLYKAYTHIIKEVKLLALTMLPTRTTD